MRVSVHVTLDYSRFLSGIQLNTEENTLLTGHGTLLTILAKKYKRHEGNLEAWNYLQSIGFFFLQLFHISCIRTESSNNAGLRTVHLEFSYKKGSSHFAHESGTLTGTVVTQPRQQLVAMTECVGNGAHGRETPAWV